MARTKKKAPKARSPIQWGLQLHKPQKFRHRADRRPKDARRTQIEAD